jgi:DNA-binding IclR family transcriptional regulator
MTYADVARALGISQPTVKRIFASRNCTLERLEAICELVQVDLADLARGAPRNAKLIQQLTEAQEKELTSDPKLLMVAISAMHHLRLADMVELYRLDEAECLRLLLRLERIGILELHENNRIRLRLARTFAWIPNGPIMRRIRAETADFFDHAFDGRGETLRMFSVRLSAESQALMLRQAEQFAREYADQHSADARLPLEQRDHMTVLLAVRTWEPRFFKALRRPGS